MVDQLSTEVRFALLKCGVEAWNAFRRDFPNYIVLNFASLPDAQLADVDLHCVYLMESDLRRANLAGAILERAILRKSDFHGSNLRRAILDRADLCRADFSAADLRGASLASAFLKRTDLRGADLSTALGLTAAQIGDAFGDSETKLPEDLARPASWAA
jgi:uncharacterized protein YjbI with pentapeptide repeats